jgi:ABC-type Fe3+-hydroxamate transport system substrate-binding protein/adenosylcobinamide amidohydrolase
MRTFLKIIFFFIFATNVFAFDRVVSINPSITQILFALGVGDKVVGVTYHDTIPFEATRKEIIGGFFAPSIKRIKKLSPDLIFCSENHKKVIETFKNKCKIMILSANNAEDVWKNIRLLGELFHKEKEAKEIIEKNKKEIELVEKKLKFVPEKNRKKVIRLMGSYFVPGKDSFQIDQVRKAGGIPFVPKNKGGVVKISLEEWKSFNPDVIYICGDDKKRIKFEGDWGNVNAVKNHKIISFPCALTCRASIYYGYFVQWLSSSIYGDYFFKPENIITKSKITNKEKLKNRFDYIKSIELVTGIINDFHHKTLLMEFKKKRRVLSTLDGFKDVMFTGNHYLVPPRWNEGHKNFTEFKKNVADALHIPLIQSSLLYTGANMDNLAIKFKRYKDMKIEVFVTAGVRSNAMRSGYEKGIFITHGTINIIVLTNLALTDRAMSRSLIAVTEGKTAALQELDIRSAYNPLKLQATGTGTDNIIIVSGNGRKKDVAGGHSKFAQILANLVRKAVKEAILKQNGIIARRNIFQRLKERGIRIFELAKICSKHNKKTLKYNMAHLQSLLMREDIANYLKACFVLSDAYEYRLIDNYDFVKTSLGGKDFSETNYPPVLDRCLDNLLTGVVNGN